MLNSGRIRQGAGHEDVDGLEQRSTHRIALLIRSAKLSCERGEFLCIIRDVSETGLKLQLFHALPRCESFTLELANEDRFEIVPVWQRDGQVGFKFDNSVDLRRILSEESSFPKRPVRLNLRERAVISTTGQTHAATICNLSREGVRIETEFPLAIAQRLQIWSDHYPCRDAVVNWRKMPQFGLVLPNVLSFEELALTAARMQLPRELAAPLATSRAFSRST